MPKVDVLQVFISASAIFGIGLFWINFNEKVYKTLIRLADAPFYQPQKPAAAPLPDEEEEYDSEEDLCEVCRAH